MKKNKFLLLLLTTFSSIIAFAQDKKVDVDLSINKGGASATNSQWYTQPWVWIIGGAIFILLLVALLRSGRKD